jgi:hypothetical protein
MNLSSSPWVIGASYIGVGIGLLLYYMWLQPLFCTSGHSPRDQFIRATLMQIPLIFAFPVTAKLVPKFGRLTVWFFVLSTLTFKRVCGALSTEALLTMLLMLPNSKNIISRQYPVLAPMLVLFGWICGMVMGSQLFAFSLVSEGWGPKVFLLFLPAEVAAY